MISLLFLDQSFKVSATVLKYQILGHFAIISLCIKDVKNFDTVFDVF